MEGCTSPNKGGTSTLVKGYIHRQGVNGPCDPMPGQDARELGILKPYCVCLCARYAVRAAFSGVLVQVEQLLDMLWLPDFSRRLHREISDCQTSSGEIQIVNPDPGDPTRLITISLGRRSPYQCSWPQFSSSPFMPREVNSAVSYAAQMPSPHALPAAPWQVWLWGRRSSRLRGSCGSVHRSWARTK